MRVIRMIPLCTFLWLLGWLPSPIEGKGTFNLRSNKSQKNVENIPDPDGIGKEEDETVDHDRRIRRLAEEWTQERIDGAIPMPATRNPLSIEHHRKLSSPRNDPHQVVAHIEHDNQYLLRFQAYERQAYVECRIEYNGNIDNHRSVPDDSASGSLLDIPVFVEHDGSEIILSLQSLETIDITDEAQAPLFDDSHAIHATFVAVHGPGNYRFLVGPFQSDFRWDLRVIAASAGDKRNSGLSRSDVVWKQLSVLSDSRSRPVQTRGKNVNHRKEGSRHRSLRWMGWGSTTMPSQTGVVTRMQEYTISNNFVLPQEWLAWASPEKGHIVDDPVKIIYQLKDWDGIEKVLGVLTDLSENPSKPVYFTREPTHNGLDSLSIRVSTSSVPLLLRGDSITRPVTVGRFPSNSSPSVKNGARTYTSGDISINSEGSSQRQSSVSSGQTQRSSSTNTINMVSRPMRLELSAQISRYMVHANPIEFSVLVPDDDCPVAVGEYEQFFDTNDHMYKAVGRLFFSVGKTDYFCTGTLVKGSNDRMVIATAAHCIYDKTQMEWSDNVMFIPGQSLYGKATDSDCKNDPYGCIFPTVGIVSPSFVNADIVTGEMFKYDIGFFVAPDLDKGEYNQPLKNRKGKPTGILLKPMDISFEGIKLGKETFVFGYPAEHDPSFHFSVGRSVLSEFEDGPYVDCAWLEGGSSGGPWTQTIASTGEMVVAGVLSWGWGTNEKRSGVGASFMELKMANGKSMASCLLDEANAVNVNMFIGNIGNKCSA